MTRIRRVMAIRWLILAVLVASVTWWRWQVGVRDQDEYVQYAQSLINSLPITHSMSRLFPGLPLVLVPLVGMGLAGVALAVLVSTSLWLVTVWLAEKLSGNSAVGWLLLVIPIVLDQFTQVSTEALLVPGLLAVMWLMRSNKWMWAGVVMGGLVMVRLVVLAAIVGVVIWARQERNKLTTFLGGVGLMLGVFVGFNLWQFGSGGWWMQLKVYPEIGRSEVAIVQLGRDLIRAIDWRWYRSVVSGVGYLGLLVWIVRKLWQRVKLRENKLGLVWWQVVVMTGFVFALGPTPFLEEFSRFLVPVYAIAVVGLAEGVQVPWWKRVGLVLGSVAVVML